MTGRRAHNTLPAALGELELLVMQTLWQNPDIDARTIATEIPGERTPSLSTIQSTLERLVRKGYLSRSKRRHAYYYSAEVSRGELLGSMLGDVIRLLHDGRSDTILSSFVSVADSLDETALDELEEMIRRKKRAEGRTRE